MGTIARIISDRHRLLTRSVQSLIGICTGMVADGQLNDHEIKFLDIWLLEHRDVLTSWPGDIIGERIQTILSDGVITSEERKDLFDTLIAITNNNFSETGAAYPEEPNRLPIDDSKEIIFCGAQFCFTGKFLYGTRNACHRTTLNLGGIVVDTIIQDLDYLVIGALVNTQWSYESYGRKIEKAVELRTRNGKPTIISEQRWENAIRTVIS